MCEQGVSFVAEQELGISPLLQAFLSTSLKGAYQSMLIAII